MTRFIHSTSPPVPLVHKPDQVGAFLSRVGTLDRGDTTLQLEFNYCFAQFLVKYYEK